MSRLMAMRTVLRRMRVRGMPMSTLCTPNSSE